jgi:hypothetical protein
MTRAAQRPQNGGIPQRNSSPLPGAEAGKPGIFQRVSDALGSDRIFLFYAGFYSGAMFCCGMLILWERVLS